METVLFVCTGNVCRSVIAARLLGESSPEVTVESAGLLAGRRRPTDKTLAVLKERGLDAADHRSRSFTGLTGDTPALVLTMTRQHSREVVDYNRDLLERTFTLREFARRAANCGSRRPGETIAGYAARVAGSRHITELALMDEEDDIADPIGGSLRVYRRCAREIEALVATAARLLFPPGGRGLPGAAGG